MINRKSGFTLIETIVAIAIIAVVMTLFVGSFTFATRMIHKAEVNNHSSMQAAGVMENQSTPSEIVSNKVATMIIDDKSYTIDVQVEIYRSGEVAYRKVVNQHVNP